MPQNTRTAGHRALEDGGSAVSSVRGACPRSSLCAKYPRAAVKSLKRAARCPDKPAAHPKPLADEPPHAELFTFCRILSGRAPAPK